jgi:Zn-dependent M28 family amino/carboxypeptidase
MAGPGGGEWTGTSTRRARPWPAALLLLAACAAPTGGSGGPVAERTPTPAEAEIDALLAGVSPERLDATVRRLAAFGTRHTLSRTDSDDRGIGAARRWIKAELEKVPGLEVSFDSHLVPPGPRVPRETEVVNVVAVLRGARPEAAGRLYAVAGHYDSRGSDVMDAEVDAPGANDDASGVAVVMELARVLSARRFDATLVFLATAGEEQGLLGAKAHAKAARAAGRDYRALLNLDIVGDPGRQPPGSRRIRVFSEGIPPAATPEDVKRIASLAAENDSPSRQLARYVAETAAVHRTGVEPMLVFRADRFLRGGDHLPFLAEGFPAVRFTDLEEDYARQHQDPRVKGGVRYGDLPEFVDPVYLASVARLNGAVLARMASAPSSPAAARVVTATLATDTLVRWSASPEEDTAGYEVLWRETTSPDWRRTFDAGKSTELRIDLSKDDGVFGVRAYDREGFRSPVAPCGSAKE